MKTINSFKQIQGLHFNGKVKAPLTTPEILLYLIKQNKSEEAKLLLRLHGYLDSCSLTQSADSIKYNELMVDIFSLYEKNFDMQNDFQKSFYALIMHLTETADKMHKQLRSRDANLYLVSPSMLEFMRCHYYMQMGKYVYYDENIFVGFRPCLRNKPDELFVFVKKNNHFTFNSTENAQSKLSISSLKKAKKAIKKWKGEMKVGFSHTYASMKLCELLGLNVNRANGEVRLYRQKGAGF